MGVMTCFLRNDAGAMIPPYRGERFPWIGGDAQTVRHFLCKDGPQPPPWREVITRLEDGDRLMSAFHPARGASRGCIIAVHGLNGCMDAHHILWLTPHVLDAGYSLLRVNMRGAGPARHLARHTYNAARGADLLRFIDEAARLDPGAPLYMMAHSLGGTAALNMALDFPMEAGRLAGLVAIGAPLDLVATSRRFGRWRNRPYMNYMLKGMRRIVATAPGMERRYLELAEKARSVREFDDRVTAPLSGFRDAEHYYREASVHERMREVALPVLLIQGSNDPWIPAEPCLALPEPSHSKEGGSVAVVVTRGGGHVGFHDRRLNWHVHATLSWCDAIAEREQVRRRSGHRNGENRSATSQ